MSVLANYSLLFTQLLSTLDAWVSSNTLMTLFILTQLYWREVGSYKWNDTLFPMPLESPAYMGRGRH